MSSPFPFSSSLMFLLNPVLPQLWLQSSATLSAKTKSLLKLPNQPPPPPFTAVPPPKTHNAPPHPIATVTPASTRSVFAPETGLDPSAITASLLTPSISRQFSPAVSPTTAIRHSTTSRVFSSLTPSFRTRSGPLQHIAQRNRGVLAPDFMASGRRCTSSQRHWHRPSRADTPWFWREVSRGCSRAGAVIFCDVLVQIQQARGVRP
jgi:hypothetical protein